MVEDKREQDPEAGTASIEAGQVEAPYSIYSSREKWIIVGVVALAGFYRYVSDISVQLPGCKVANQLHGLSSKDHRSCMP